MTDPITITAEHRVEIEKVFRLKCSCGWEMETPDPNYAKALRHVHRVRTTSE